MKTTYSHSSGNLPFKLSVNNRVSISRKNYDRYNYLLNVCLLAHDLARLIGIKNDYSTTDSRFESLTIRLPELSALTTTEIKLLKGWKYFQSCVKGFNSLGLIAEQILPIYNHYKQNPEIAASDLQEFKNSRVNYNKILNEHQDIAGYADRLKPKISDSTNILCLAIWKTFAYRPIICSTSSNMGISLHECIRAFQSKPISIENNIYALLRPDEGKLVIWCPDREADFMNNEKSDMLQSLVDEYTKTTKLRTYINRQQRDPGALSDALSTGGYFFPTNPQSPEEVQNLLFVGLKELAFQRGCQINDLLEDPKVNDLLDSLESEIVDNTVIVTRGVEGGIGGLMIPYFIMVEEHLRNNQSKDIKLPSTWNQASIGAALAATVIADNILRDQSKINSSNQELIHRNFAFISNHLRSASKICSRSVIHGLFDLANIQSLAQLLGVTVLRHTSGRGTAFVGLGSSSYSNGNLCFEILNDSARNNLSFKGKDTFHPATHTMNFIAQAIIYGEGIALKKQGHKHADNEFDKPEPAGAAALAGFLLLLLDNQLLSIFEIAQLLQKLGFTEEIFLKFCNFSPNQEGKSSFIQLAFEEGPCMGNFSSNLLDLLSLDPVSLSSQTVTESTSSLDNRKKFQHLSKLGLSSKFINYIYSTGNNTEQPTHDLEQKLSLQIQPTMNLRPKEKLNLLSRFKAKIIQIF